jgi:hypothetical protein
LTPAFGTTTVRASPFLLPMDDNNLPRRSLDAGGGFVVEEHEHDPPAACAQGVHVETPFDLPDAQGQVKLVLRSAERHDGGLTYADKERVSVAIDLASGRCTPTDSTATVFLAERPWLQKALARCLGTLRNRALRVARQRDKGPRYTTCFAAIDVAPAGDLIPHDRLFPDDWDLLLPHDARTYWVIQLHCPNPACDCSEMVVQLHDITDPPRAVPVGEIRLDLHTPRLHPTASSKQASALFQPLWSRYGADLLMRRREVHDAVLAFGAAREVLRAPHASRPAPSVTRNIHGPTRNGP